MCPAIKKLRQSIFSIVRILLINLIILSPFFISSSGRPAAAQDVDLSQRYVLFLDGINSFSDGQTAVNGDFNFIRSELEKIGISRFVYFSYGAAAGFQSGSLYCDGWKNGCSSQGNLGDLSDLFSIPIYQPADTHLKANLQADALNWLIGQIIKKDPSAQIDLIGFSLGGITDAYWGSHNGIGSPYRSHIHAIVAVESPLGGIPFAAQCLDPSNIHPICSLVLRPKFGTDVLTELQIPESNPGSIVDELPDVARNYLFTSIQSTGDYLVNDLSFPVNGGFYGTLSAPVGRGSQYWIESRQTLQDKQDLGGRKIAVSPVPVLEVSDWIFKNHLDPLKHSQTATWIIGAITAEPEASTVSFSVSPIMGRFFANPSAGGNFTATPQDTELFRQTFAEINFNPPPWTISCGNATGVDINTRPFTDVIPQPDGTCQSVVAQGNGLQAGVGDLFAFHAVFQGSFTITAAAQITFNFYSDDGWILSIGTNAAGKQPAYVSGPLINAPSAGPFSGYSIVGSFNMGSPVTQNNLVVNFPDAGTFPFELDYTEGLGGELALTLNADSSTIPAGGTITGSVFQNHVDPESVLAGSIINVCSGERCHTSITSTQGVYTVSGLAPGSYTVTAFPTEISPLLQRSIGPVIVTSRTTITVQPIVLTGPTRPPAGTTITNRGIGGGGIPIVHWADPLILTTTGCLGGNATYKILQNGSLAAQGSMQEQMPGAYAAVISPLYPSHGNAEVIITMTCTEVSTDVAFDIYIDPSGSVVTTEGMPVPGATVTLLHSVTADGPFEAVPNGSGEMSLINRENPDRTDNNGRFGWDVVAGYYKVRAERYGCVSPSNSTQSFIESEVMTIPPEVTNTFLILKCEGIGKTVYLPIAIR